MVMGWGPALTLLLVPEPSAATSSPRIELHWRAPSECPDEASVRARTEALLMEPQAHAVADAEVVRTGDGFALTLALVGHAEATQQHHARDCDALADVAALVVAVAADPTLAVRSAAADEAAAAPEPAPAPTPTPPDPPPPSASESIVDPLAVVAIATDDDVGPRPPPGPAVGGLLGLHGVVGRAELPGVDVGVGIVAAIAWRRLRAELGGRYLAVRRRPITGVAGVHASVASWNTTVAGCADFVAARVRIGPCLGLELGVVSAIADDAPVPLRSRALWLAGFGRLALRWPADERVQIDAGLEGVVALRRPSFALRERPAAAVVTGPGGVRATLGFVVALGHLRRNWRPGDPIGRSRR